MIKYLGKNRLDFSLVGLYSEQIFTLRKFTAKRLEYQQKMVFNVLDFTKVLDSVHRDALWKLLRHYGIPAKIVKLIKALYDESACYMVYQDIEQRHGMV